MYTISFSKMSSKTVVGIYKLPVFSVFINFIKPDIGQKPM